MRRKQIGPDVWYLLINGKPGRVSTVAGLRRLIISALRKQFAEVHLLRGELPEHNLFAVFNGTRAAMSYTRNIDEASWSARNDEETRRNEEVEFFLSNGQRDVYSYRNTIDAKDALKAFEYLFQNEALPSQINWHKDL